MQRGATSLLVEGVYMPLTAAGFPIATEFDPVEDPPGSIDPLGTLSYAERLAEALFPGMTGRMYRPRLLTMAVVAAAVAELVVDELGRGEEVRLEARLAFERLAASALARMRVSDPDEWTNAARRLPGRVLAQRALKAGEPLTRHNFLRGQAVNGASGVVLRLARNLQFIDDHGRLGRAGRELLLVWADEQKIPGLLDEISGSDRAGAKWIREVVRFTSAVVSGQEWPGPNQRVWDMLAGALRLDGTGPNEGKLLYSSLMADAIRGRMIKLLEARTALSSYADAANSGRQQAERVALQNGVKPELKTTADDQTISAILATIDAYEQMSGLFQQGFDGINWALKLRGGRAQPDAISSDPRLSRYLEATAAGIRRALPRLDSATRQLAAVPACSGAEFLTPLQTIRDEAERAALSQSQLLDVLMERHSRVQHEKRKSAWIERDVEWTLMPGFGFEGTNLPRYDQMYLHGYRVPNMYSFLADLGRVSMKVDDHGETE